MSLRAFPSAPVDIGVQAALPPWSWLVFALVAAAVTGLLLRRLGSLPALAGGIIVLVVVTDPAVLAHAQSSRPDFIGLVALFAALGTLAAAGSETVPAGWLRLLAAGAVAIHAASAPLHVASGFVLLILFGAACFLSRQRDLPTLFLIATAAIAGFAFQVAMGWIAPAVDPAHVSAFPLDGSRAFGRALADAFTALRGAAPESPSPGFASVADFAWSDVLQRLPPLEYALFLFGPAALVAVAAVAGVFRLRPAGVTFAWLAFALLPYPMLAAVVLAGHGVAQQAWPILACLLSFWIVLALSALVGSWRLASDTARGTVFRALDAARTRGRTGAVATQQPSSASSAPGEDQSRPQT